MSDVICLLSDSDDSDSPILNEASKAEQIVAAKSPSHSPALGDDFDFPAVPFAYVPSRNKREKSRDDWLDTTNVPRTKKFVPQFVDQREVEEPRSDSETSKSSVNSNDDDVALYNRNHNTELTGSNSSCNSEEMSESLNNSLEKDTDRKLKKLSKTSKTKLQNHNGAVKLKSRRVEPGEHMKMTKDSIHVESTTSKSSGYSEVDIEDELYRKYTTVRSMSSMSHDSQEEITSLNVNQINAKAWHGNKLNKADGDEAVNSETRVKSLKRMTLIKDSIHTQSTSSKSSGYSEDDFIDQLHRKYIATESSNGLSYDDQGKSDSPTDSQTKTKPRKAGKLSEEDREKLKEEKLRKQEEAARLKATRAALAQSVKCVKPGECMKFIKVSIDSNITNTVFCPELLTALQQSEIRYVVESQLTQNSIIWRRDIQEHYVDGNHKVCVKSKTQEENQMIVIWNWEETVRRVEDRTFVEKVANTLTTASSKAVTLVIYGMEEYFRYQKNLKKQAVKNSALGNDKGKGRIKSGKTFEGSPIISRRELELLLTEIQLVINVKHRLVETPQDLGLLVCQYTKAIAEAPFKLERRQQLQDKMDWYVSGDNRNCVRIDKDGNGLRTLWQQQLCQFNLARLETAQAIASKYPSPLSLMEAYMNCTSTEGAKLLQDIPIRRAAGPLTTSRRIGPELSKKVYVMFTSEDGEAVLGNG